MCTHQPDSSPSTPATEQPARSFEAFCAQVMPRLLAHLRRNTRSAEDARDTCQEVLARAWSRWDDVSRMDAPGAWAMTVANNLLADAWRREQRRQDALPRLAFEPVAAGDRAASLVVREAVLGLPPDVRDAVLLYYFQDWTLAGIAEAAGVPPTTVKHRLHRGRQVLRSRLDGFDATEPRRDADVAADRAPGPRTAPVAARPHRAGPAVRRPSARLGRVGPGRRAGCAAVPGSSDS